MNQTFRRNKERRNKAITDLLVNSISNDYYVSENISAMFRN